MPRPTHLVQRLLPVLSGRGTGRLQTVTKLGALEVVSAPGFSRLIGKLADSQVPRPLLRAAIQLYVQHYDVNVDEMEKALEEYDTFDAFFTRRLKPGVHTIDPDPNVAVSPVDGRVMSFGAVSEGRIEQVKGRDYSIEELLDSQLDAERFQQGSFVTLYLSPRDYHRIHSPVSGRITGYRYIPGRLYPVNATGVKHIDRLFAVNERIISYVKSSLGEFAVVKVGATNVGKITLSYHDIQTNDGKRTAYNEQLKRPASIERGAELGTFHLGSTVVVLASNANLKLLVSEAHETFRVGVPLFRKAD
jgi:phosphatidylserine decarboxylase